MKNYVVDNYWALKITWRIITYSTYLNVLVDLLTYLHNLQFLM